MLLGLVEKEMQRHLMRKKIQEQKELKENFLNMFPENQRSEIQKMLDKANLPKLMEELGFRNLSSIVAAADKGELREKMDVLVKKNQDQEILVKFFQLFPQEKQGQILHLISKVGITSFLKSFGETSMKDLLARVMEEQKETA